METNVFNQWIGGACGCSENISPFNTVFQKVDELPALGDATRNHAYILPNNTVWVVNSEGTDFSQLNGGSGSGGAYDDTELRDLIQSVADRNTMEDNRLVNIENKNATQDQRLTALENKNTEYDSYFEEVSEAIGELQSQAGGVTYTAGKNIDINNNVISVITTYPDAFVNDESINAMSSVASPYGSSSTGIGDVAIFNIVGYMNEGDVIELNNKVHDGELVWDIEYQGTNEIYINGVLFKSESTDNGVKLTVLDRGAYKADTLINLSLMMRVQ